MYQQVESQGMQNLVRSYEEMAILTFHCILSP